eukprot:scaffold234029_cov20-Tisochrysis_lutea.AAC.1
MIRVKGEVGRALVWAQQKQQQVSEWTNKSRFFYRSACTELEQIILVDLDLRVLSAGCGGGSCGAEAS